MADIYSGMVTAFGITQALFMRERTGKGQFVDSAMYDNMVSLNESMIALHSAAGQSPHRGRPRNAYPRGAYQARDGYVAVNVPDERIWRRWCEIMQRPDLIDDPRSNNGTARSQNREFVDSVISQWFAGLARDEAAELLNSAGVPTGPVHTAEDVFACPQVQARHMLMPVADPNAGEFRFARTPPHLSAAPELPARPAPELGEHTRVILEKLLGYGSQEIDALAAEGVVQVR
jgi:formyl-CoA transferase